MEANAGDFCAGAKAVAKVLCLYLYMRRRRRAMAKYVILFTIADRDDGDDKTK